jgi:DeoR family ulaG and ulaABCDEF operon transcriptional repressor
LIAEEREMHEIERHRIILAEAEAKPVVQVSDLVSLLDSSEATIRRDIKDLHAQGKLRKVRGGAEALQPPGESSLIGRPYSVNQTINAQVKREIARKAAELLDDSMSVMISGGTTTAAMAEFLTPKKLQVLTNSFVIAQQLISNSKCSVTLPGGKVYREQKIILSPFSNDITSQIYASVLFLGAQGVGPQGVMEADPQIVQAVMKLLHQAEKRVLMVDSSKFTKRSNLIVCPLSLIDTVITDDKIDLKSRKMIEAAGCELIIVNKNKNK